MSATRLQATDVPERVDFRRLALISDGLFDVVDALADAN